jgi:hypothetical protein
MRSWIGLVLVACLAPGPGFSQKLSLTLPEPPHQRGAWRAPAGVSTNILSAVETLFAQGFPDPRGCEYREVEVQAGDVWTDKGSRVKTRGWVLPAKGARSPRFAVCWNGLVYPVTNIGSVADLHADTASPVLPGSRRSNSAVGEARSVLFMGGLSTRGLLLLRSGEIDAALRIWAPYQNAALRVQATNRMQPEARVRSEDYDPYLEIAGDWAWALFDRTICAHMRGDEALALATARKLAEIQPKIEAEAARRGFRRQEYYESARRGKQRPYLDFLEQLPEILADLEHRAREEPRVSVVVSGLTNLPAQAERIAALVRDLELVQARQWSQPGWVNPAEDPIVQALIMEGDPAVEPLLECLEKDKRLTRSAGFGRDFFRGQTVIPVASAARAALQAILHASFGGGAPEMRAYWLKYKSLTLEDRWYAILADDTAGAGRWREAAANITQPENITTYPGTMWSVEHPASTNAPTRLRGEPLRGKANPSVSELLSRRAVEVPPSNPGAYDLGAGCELGLRLAAWDPSAAVLVAGILMERCHTVSQYSDQREPWVAVARFTLVRAQAGDLQALDDYAAWLQTISPEQVESSFAEAFEPLCKYATNAVMEAAAERLFGNTNSAWGRLPWKLRFHQDPIASDLVKVPAFRRLLAGELDKKAPCGSIEWHQGSAAYELTNSTRGSRRLAWPEGDPPADGTKAELRWCDWTAWSLSNAKQIPFYNPFAPVDQRDEAIAKAKALLQRR